jgi:GDPmannose 4,6-dehydratase
MWLMLQQESPADYVIATGKSYTIREFLGEAFGYVDLDWQQYVLEDPRYFRPTEVHHLRGDASLAVERLGWRPRVSFSELVRMMVDADVELARQERTLHDAGHTAARRGLAHA